MGQLYGTSTMEHHHFDSSVAILNREGHNIFQNLAGDQYGEALGLFEHAILATDLSLYFKNRDKFKRFTDGDAQFDPTSADDRALLRSMMMTGCDIGAITKPWAVQKRIALIVYSEFFEQGDLEREKGHEVPAMMDRHQTHELPKMQIGFIDFICTPLYKMLASFDPAFQPLLDGCLDNRKHWLQLKERGDFHADETDEMGSQILEGTAPEEVTIGSRSRASSTVLRSDDLGEVDKLRAEVARLRAEVARLQENAAAAATSS